MVTIEDAAARLAKVRFTTTKQYTGPLEHQYIMTHFQPGYMQLWYDMRALIVAEGEDRPFLNSRHHWRYLDMPDGWTYWVMPQWVADDWETHLKPSYSYVLNRKKTNA